MLSFLKIIFTVCATVCILRLILQYSNRENQYKLSKLTSFYVDDMNCVNNNGITIINYKGTHVLNQMK